MIDIIYTEDPVSTVRYSMVSLLPNLRRMIRLPTDRRLLQSLEQVIMQLEKNEKDRDVLTNLIKRSKEMMIPYIPGTNDEFELNQRRLMEEEELIFKGKLAFHRTKTESKTQMTVRRETVNVDKVRCKYKFCLLKIYEIY